MTSQLDEDPTQILASNPKRKESPSRRRPWIVTTAAVAGVALGAGLIIDAVRTDNAGSPVGDAEQGDTTTRGVSVSLPPHLQEFEVRTRRDSVSDE